MNEPGQKANKPAAETSRRSPGPGDLFRALRPNQWTKNIIVFAALFFAFWDRSRGHTLNPIAFYETLLAFLIFCMTSSGIYVLNDIKDINVDRTHPTKRNRPVASGLIPLPYAWTMSIALICSGFLLSLLLPIPFTMVIAAYVIIQVIYSHGLKQIALVDVLVIASGFVLRAISGAVAMTGVTISPWLLLCTFLLALFLGLCKRRHEKFFFNDTHRPSLEKYDQTLLDQLIAITSSATIVSYSIYTLWPKTVEKFGTQSLGFTIPFVVFAIFRYLDLVYRHEKGDRPEMILLTDIPLIVVLVFYALSLLTIFTFHL